MSNPFSIFRNNVRRKREQQQAASNTNRPSSNAITYSRSSSNSADTKEQTTYSKLESIARVSASPEPSPTSSSSSRSRPAVLEPEELEDNCFYQYIRSHYNMNFSNSTVVCIPHSKSLEGLVLTKDFIKTHLYTRSPYYLNHCQAANGKVIYIELPTISTGYGFKERRTVNVLAEECVYIATKKIKVFMIDRPLEGEPVPQHPRNITMSIPTTRSVKEDLDFLRRFPQNAEPLHELQLAAQKFVNTYVYIRGFNSHTVEKIQHMYDKTCKGILQRNKLLQDACRAQSERDHFLELVENVVMGFVHDKIWVQSLKAIGFGHDDFLDKICRAYSKETITLDRYAVSHPMASMPLECFEAAISCLRRVDSDAEPPISAFDDEEPSSSIPTTTTTTEYPAFTPLEKLACVQKTLNLISEAVTKYIRENAMGTTDDDSPVTTDEMIPLLAYTLVHSGISRISSLVFYMEKFRLSRVLRPEHSFALITLKAAMDFLKGDPLSLYDVTSATSTLSTTSTSSAALSPKLDRDRTRSTSFGPPVTSAQANSAPVTPVHHYRSISMSSQPISGIPGSIKMQQHAYLTPTPRLRHRKSHSADLQGLAAAVDVDDGCSEDKSSRRNSLTPSVVVRPPIVLPSPREPNRRSLDITNDWMMHGKPHQLYANIVPSTPTTKHPSSFAAPKATTNISQSRPLVSATFPAISNSSPLPNFARDMSSPSSPTSSSSPIPNDTTDGLDNNRVDTRKLARSLSSTSSLCKKKLNNPPEVIDICIKDTNRRPASICIDPRSMHRNDSDELMGPFVGGLQNEPGDIVGGSSTYRTVRLL